jgi:hypothetical protein
MYLCSDSKSRSERISNMSIQDILSMAFEPKKAPPKKTRKAKAAETVSMLAGVGRLDEAKEDKKDDTKNVTGDDKKGAEENVEGRAQGRV